MDLTFVCPRCGLVLKVDTLKDEGKPARCPNCLFMVMSAAKKASVIV